MLEFIYFKQTGNICYAVFVPRLYNMWSIGGEQALHVKECRSLSRAKWHTKVICLLLHITMTYLPSNGNSTNLWLVNKIELLRIILRMVNMVWRTSSVQSIYCQEIDSAFISITHGESHRHIVLTTFVNGINYVTICLHYPNRRTVLVADITL